MKDAEMSNGGAHEKILQDKKESKGSERPRKMYQKINPEIREMLGKGTSQLVALRNTTRHFGK